MKVSTFEVSHSLEALYRRELFKLVTSWLPVKLKDMSPDYWLKELASVSTRRSIADASTKVVVNMVTRINVSNLKSWRAAAYKAQGGPLIYHLLREELRGQNGLRIRGFISDTTSHVNMIPRESARELLTEITKAQQAGITSSAIEEILKFRFPQILRSKVAMFARTGVSSASTALTRARSEELGLPCFVWETSSDQRVRHSHRIMERVAVFWNDLPSPEQLDGKRSYLGKYAPGDAPNCRCYPRPILTLEDLFSNKVSNIKVYQQGSIIRMSRSEFAKLSGIESRIAA